MLLEILLKSIINVNHDNMNYLPKKVDIISVRSKYSSSGLPTDKIRINDNIILNRNDKLTYICPTCQ
jgi:hypothetical protein